MKTSYLFAAASAVATSAHAFNTSNIEERMVDYFDLTPDKPELNPEITELKEEIQASPKVQTYGYETTSLSDNGLLGYELGLNADLGWLYHLPLYNQDNQIVFRQIGAIFGGGRQYFSITAYFVRVNLYLDLWLSKLTVDNYMAYNIVEKKDFCQSTNWFLDVARASLLVQLDVNECKWGLVGSITDDTSDCEWGTYYIGKPLWDAQPFYEQSRGVIMEGTCEGEVPAYDA